MSKAMHLNHNIFEVLPLRNHNIANEVVEIVLGYAWNSSFDDIVVNFHLNVRTMSFEAVLLQKRMDFIPVNIYFCTARTQIQVAVIHIGGLGQWYPLSPSQVPVNQRVHWPQLFSFEQHAQRPH